jgi:transposase
VVSTDDKVVIGLSLSGGESHDAPEGRKLLESIGKAKRKTMLVMDRAYEDDATRLLAKKLNYVPIVPPRATRKFPWKYDKELYKCRNVIERLFRRIKEFRRICTRYDKLDVSYIGFVYFCFSIIYLNCVNTP